MLCRRSATAKRSMATELAMGKRRKKLRIENCKMKTANWLTAVLVVAAFCLLPTAYCFGQDTPGTVKCPSSQDSLDSLFRVADSPRAKLLTAIDASATSMTVTSTSAFPATGSLKINEEIIYYTGKTSDTFSGLVRGASGTTAAGHVSNSDIFAPRSEERRV